MIKTPKYCKTIDGGYQFAYNAKSKGKSVKREKKFLFTGYTTKKALYDDIERYTVQIKSEVAQLLNKPKIDGKIPNKITNLSDAIKLRIAREGDSGISGYFRRIATRWGVSTPDQWRDTYYEAINRLSVEYSFKTKDIISPATLNRYKSAFALIFKFAIKEQVISDLQIEYDLDHEEGRDRILSPEEWTRLQEVMEGHWLEMSIKFAYYNPVRAADQFGFKSKVDPDDNNEGLRIKHWNREKNRIEFRAHKTFNRKKNRKVQTTYLMQINDEMKAYFESLPQDPEQHLFPQIKDGEIKPMRMQEGDYGYRLAFELLLKKAGIENFNWHDLKHCAITYIVRNLPPTVNVFMYLRELGIQFSEKMVMKYFHADVDEAPRLEGFR
jgi:hypothetical protein